MPNESVEEYLEAVYDLGGERGVAKTGDLAARLKVTPASVTEVLQRLSKKGLVTYQPYKGASLTKKGLDIAKKIKRKHRILEVFLSKYLRIRDESVHDQACKMEHVVSDETEAALCRMMGNPSHCPDGKPIPPCGVKDCGGCDEGCIQLTDMKPGQKATLVRIHGGQGVCKRLSEMGLTPGIVLTLVRTAPLKGPTVIRVRGCELALGAGIASRVYVRPEA